MRMRFWLRNAASFLATLALSTGCAPTRWGYVVQPPDDLRECRPFNMKDINMPSDQKNTLIEEVKSRAKQAILDAQKNDPVEMVCVSEADWEIAKPEDMELAMEHYRNHIEDYTFTFSRSGGSKSFACTSSAEEEAARTKEIKGVAHALKTSTKDDKDLKIEETFAFVRMEITKINNDFGRFNDLLSLAAKKTGDRAWVLATLTQGITTMFRARSFLDLVEAAVKANCSLKPLQGFVDFAKNIIEETSDVRMIPMINQLEKMGVPPSVVAYYRTVVAVMKRESTDSVCNNLNAFAGSDEYYTDILAWCGYSAYLSGNGAQAKDLLTKAKSALSNPVVSAYAQKMLKVIK